MKNSHIKNPVHNNILKELNERIKQVKLSQELTQMKLWGKAFLYLSIIGMSLFTILESYTKTGLVAGYVIYGFSTLLLAFNFAHDLSHNATFKGKKANNFFYTLIYTLVGAHAESWKHRHVHSHHHAPNVKDFDTDLQITALIRVEPSAERKWYHAFQFIYAPIIYGTYSIYWIYIKDFVVYIKAFQKHSIGDHISFIAQKLTYAGLMLAMPMLFSNFGAKDCFIAFLIMHYTQSLFLLFTFFITHHTTTTSYFEPNEDGVIPTSWFENQIKSSNDFYPFSFIANTIFGGFNNHVAHHLFPNVNHIHYPKMNRVIYSVLAEHEIHPNKSSYLGGIILHLKHLRNMGRK